MGFDTIKINLVLNSSCLILEGENIIYYQNYSYRRNVSFLKNLANKTANFTINKVSSLFFCRFIDTLEKRKIARFYISIWKYVPSHVIWELPSTALIYQARINNQLEGGKKTFFKWISWSPMLIDVIIKRYFLNIQ